MNLRNLTVSNNSPINSFLNKNLKLEDERELEVTNNAIIIPKRLIPKLQKSSGFFEAFIDRNFSNSNERFDNYGNYIFKKDLIPNSSIFYDKNTNEEYVINRNDIWKAFPEVLTDGHIPDPILGKFIADYFTFNTNSFFKPTLAESETITKPNGYYISKPSRKQLKKIRAINKELYDDNNNSNNDLPFHMRPYRRTGLELIENRQNALEYLQMKKRRENLQALKKDLIRNKKANVEDLAEALQNSFTKKYIIANAINQTKKATANRTKYGKSKTQSKKSIKEQRKEKRRTQRRNVARSRKTLKQLILNENEIEN